MRQTTGNCGLAQGAMMQRFVVLTMVFAPISFGPVQFRIAEALCILPFYTGSRARTIRRMPAF